MDTFNPKYEFISLQNKIRSISSGNNNEIFSLPKQMSKNPEVLQAQKNETTALFEIMFLLSRIKAKISSDYFEENCSDLLPCKTKLA